MCPVIRRVLAAVSALFPIAFCLWLAGAPLPKSDRRLETGVFNSSLRCGECHAEIYATWRRSLHSMAVRDPIFDLAYSQAYRATAGEARKLCLRCHAPVAFLTGDLELREPLSQEGIVCDFCHSTASVDLGARGFPYKVSLDGVKRGPLADAGSPAHKTSHSEIFRNAEICGGCHEYANEKGLLIFSTYSEWKVSPQAAEGKPCQHCHMPKSSGRTVLPGVGVGRQGINLHDISGAHSSEQVRKAATLTIRSLRRTQPESAIIEVEITNVGSGHYIPTGMPTRKLVLEVDLLVGGRRLDTLTRTYQRVLLDAEGHRIDEDYRVVQEAKSLLSDNRIRAGEKRVERIVARVPARGRLTASARLRYVYEPTLQTSTRMSVVMVSDEASERP